jgi:hypothetical protein
VCRLQGPNGKGGFSNPSQLGGNGGSLIFERDLEALAEFLERPHPEFFGAQVNDQPGGEL